MECRKLFSNASKHLESRQCQNSNYRPEMRRDIAIRRRIPRQDFIWRRKVVIFLGMQQTSRKPAATRKATVTEKRRCIVPFNGILFGEGRARSFLQYGENLRSESRRKEKMRL
ncbi:hypothetical protein HNY73_001832 [Argiope bruennichi]|uniref:Uncharacterized protein n=1 Tax=Argiope bruennichi TaxID=94029 RepID=A0A8T0FY79_ARGBR|nr:hypothetical protein HNY73_001832 [Argiope bruennichi]